MKRGIYLLVLIGVVILLVSSIASAGLFDWFKKITGQLTSQPTNVSITVTGVNAVNVSVISGTLPTVAVSNDGTGAMVFYVTVADADGAADINTTSVTANFSKTGENLRQNTSCLKVGSDLTATSQNYSCTIYMWYFDAMGTWNINVGAKDLGNTTYIYNTTTTFQLPQLQGIEISPLALTFGGVSTGSINQTATNDPTTINNTGNYQSNISVKGIDLYGDVVSTQFIGVGNASVSNNTGSSIECSVTASVATTLLNGTEVHVINSNLTRGNRSIGDGRAQEQIYYCFRTIPTGIQSQAYSTATGGSWTIKLL